MRTRTLIRWSCFQNCWTRAASPMTRSHLFRRTPTQKQSVAKQLCVILSHEKKYREEMGGCAHSTPIGVNVIQLATTCMTLKLAKTTQNNVVQLNTRCMTLTLNVIQLRTICMTLPGPARRGPASSRSGRTRPRPRPRTGRAPGAVRVRFWDNDSFGLDLLNLTIVKYTRNCAYSLHF